MDSPVREQLVLRWQGDWRTTAFVAVFLPLLLGLGIWQLGRAEEKRAIAAVWEERQSQAPAALPASSLPGAEQVYRRVALRGEYLPGRTVLLDNRMREGRYGLEVLVPFRLLDGRLVLVNRGWVEGDRARRTLPEVATPGGEHELLGSIYVSPGAPFTLGEAAQDEQWPQLVLALDVATIEGLLGETLHPFSVRLDADSETALLARWPLLNSTPEKHLGYAIQWFSMAAALLLLYLFRSSNLWAWLRRGRTDD